MKKYLKIFWVLSLLFICKVSVADNNEPIPVLLDREHNELPDRWGERMPPRPIQCFISQSDGITIGIDKDDIIAFELWDVNAQHCIASFTDETSFLNLLFNSIGEFQIRFLTIDYRYIGYISIN